LGPPAAPAAAPAAAAPAPAAPPPAAPATALAASTFMVEAKKVCARARTHTHTHGNINIYIYIIYTSIHAYTVHTHTVYACIQKCANNSPERLRENKIPKNISKTISENFRLCDSGRHHQNSHNCTPTPTPPHTPSQRLRQRIPHPSLQPSHSQPQFLLQEVLLATTQELAIPARPQRGWGQAAPRSPPPAPASFSSRRSSSSSRPPSLPS